MTQEERDRLVTALFNVAYSADCQHGHETEDVKIVRRHARELRDHADA